MARLLLATGKKMRREDPRVTRTRRQLRQALVSVTLEKGYEAVTIRDITGRAGVGYATFFRHYGDKEQLLADVLEAMVQELLALLPALGLEADPVRSGTLLFEHAGSHSALYQVFLSSRNASLVWQRLHQVGVAAILAAYEGSARGAVPEEVAANHILAATLALLQWWLEHGQPLSAAQMGQIFAELIIRPAEKAAFGA